MSCWFVTGTDTGVGKTFLTAALARRAREIGERVFAFKPIETGCTPGQLGEDQRELVAAAGGWQQGELGGLYSLARPVAPWVAARDEGVTIDIDRILAIVQEASRSVDRTLVEGAGGWRVPVTADLDMAGLAQRLGGRVVVVARATLGTINHSLLTLEAVERDGCTVVALVLSLRPEDDRSLAESNVQEISRRWPGQISLFDGGASKLDRILRST